MDGRVTHCVEVAIYAADTIAMYLQIVAEVQTDQRLDEMLVAHPLMVRELEHQAADLALLHTAPKVTDTLVDVLRSGSQWVLEAE